MDTPHASSEILPAPAPRLPAPEEDAEGKHPEANLAPVLLRAAMVQAVNPTLSTREVALAAGLSEGALRKARRDPAYEEQVRRCEQEYTISFIQDAVHDPERLRLSLLIGQASELLGKVVEDPTARPRERLLAAGMILKHGLGSPAPLPRRKAQIAKKEVHHVIKLSREDREDLEALKKVPAADVQCERAKA